MGIPPLESRRMGEPSRPPCSPPAYRGRLAVKKSGGNDARDDLLPRRWSREEEQPRVNPQSRGIWREFF
jgi:hypothetical protein